MLPLHTSMDMDDDDAHSVASEASSYWSDNDLQPDGSEGDDEWESGSSSDDEDAKSPRYLNRELGPKAFERISETLKTEIAEHVGQLWHGVEGEAARSRRETYMRNVATWLVTLAQQLPGVRNPTRAFAPHPDGCEYAASVRRRAGELASGAPLAFESVLKQWCKAGDLFGTALKDALEKRQQESSSTFDTTCIDEFRRQMKHMGTTHNQRERKRKAASMLLTSEALAVHGGKALASKRLGLSTEYCEQAARMNDHWRTQEKGAVHSPPRARRRTKEGKFAMKEIHELLHHCPLVELDKDRKLTFQRRSIRLDGKKFPLSCERSIIQGNRRSLVDWFMMECPGKAHRSTVYKCICPCMKLKSGISDCCCPYCWTIVHKQKSLRLLVQKGSCSCSACAEGSSWRKALQSFHDLRAVVHSPCGKVPVPEFRLPHETTEPMFYKWACCRPKKPP